MSALPHLKTIFDRLRGGHHMSPPDEPEFSALVEKFDAYADYFAPLGLKLIRDPREFFYFESTKVEISETLPRVAVFSFILVDDAATLGRNIEEFLFNTPFSVSGLPHFKRDRYRSLLRAVAIQDATGLRPVLQTMKGFGWVTLSGEEQFRLLRPFYRMLDKCFALAAPEVIADTDAHSER